MTSGCEQVSSLLQLIGFALLAVWAGMVFGWPASLLVAGVELLILGVATSDDFHLSTWLAARRQRRRHRREAQAEGIV